MPRTTITLLREYTEAYFTKMTYAEKHHDKDYWEDTYSITMYIANGVVSMEAGKKNTFSVN